MTRIGTLFLSVGVSTLLASCSSAPELVVDGQPLMEAEVIYTQTNLHPDPARARLFSMNYQQNGFIPRCSKVKFTDISSERLEFNFDGRSYEYIFHPASGDFDTNLKKYFGPKCKSPELAVLSELDLKGIKDGKAYEGMSKQGVILAIGYPPVRATTSLEMNVWRYWHNRFNTFNIVFDDQGLVTDFQE